MKHLTRPDFETAVRQLGIIEALGAYDPRIAGTPPLGVDTDKSDIDILCHAPDAEAFLSDIIRLYGAIGGFRVWQWISEDRPVIVSFHAHQWDFEIFASPRPVASQYGWRHFQMEKRLLTIGGDNFKRTIKSLRQQGLKTEPAFWCALKEQGDAYRGLLTLEAATDDELREKLTRAGFDPVPPSSSRW
ncbi:MAG: DUF4269 domain-containing protein [Allorhizobium sp.]